MKKSEAGKFWTEARELHLIFCKIWKEQNMNFVVLVSALFRHWSFVIRHFPHA